MMEKIHDKALAMQLYFRQAQNIDAEVQCCRIRLRAERKAGELLRQMDQLKGRPTRASDDPRLLVANREPSRVSIFKVKKQNSALERSPSQ
jgi:hypothetical protein